MFVQFIEARVTDPEGVERLADRSRDELLPGAVGMLGLTSGMSDDGRLFTAVRFTDEESARRNSERPEQDAWWTEFSKCLSEVSFTESTDVTLIGEGSDDAGFVQVMRGVTRDVDAMRELMADSAETMQAERPDVLGMLVAVHADDPQRFTTVVWFTSEEAARMGEKRQPSPEAARFDEAFGALLAGDLEFLDLPNPRMA